MNLADVLFIDIAKSVRGWHSPHKERLLAMWELLPQTTFPLPMRDRFEAKLRGLREWAEQGNFDGRDCRSFYETAEEDPAFWDAPYYAAHTIYSDGENGSDRFMALFKGWFYPANRIKASHRHSHAALKEMELQEQNDIHTNIGRFLAGDIL